MKNGLSIIENEKAYCHDQIEKTEKLNIILYLVSKTVSLLGSNIYYFILSLYILKVTRSGGFFAINVLVGMLPRIIFGPFAGILADRVNRKKLTIFFDIISGIIVFSFLGVSTISGLSVVSIYVTSFILSSISVFYDTALSSSIPNLARDEMLMKINSYTSTSVSISGVLSPILAGIIYGFVPINLILIINGASFIFSAALELFIDFKLNSSIETKVKSSITFDNIKKELKEVIKFVGGQQIIYALLKYVLIINLFLSASMTVVYPYIINNVLKMSSSHYGTFQGIYFIGMIVASIIMGNRKEKKVTGKKLGLELGIIGVVLILVGLQTTLFYDYKMQILLSLYNIVLLFILGAVLIVINTPIMVMIQRLTPENLRGRITGLLGTLSQGIAPLGIIVAGVLIDKINPFIILAASGVIIIVSSMHMIWSKELKSL
ncbi:MULTISPECIES: MFS transporter [unclassified Clostridium]|uniref:MFS transporter n=1 Tax=unclassified Clostridium TaxID=2614128 RepID=UPI000298085E|nr:MULTISPECIES: MFS transporter [unclassified Clostridium]EKQ50189.1 MAG: Major Facilitator Superfamily transporter [Clostridium sp. Maddingley MBC34-26]